MAAEALDSLDKPELIALVLTLADQNRVLIEQNRILTEQVATLTARVATLEARLMIPPKTPGNSSLPPSKGEKANLPQTPKKRRKGRPGVARVLCPNPDHVREIYAASWQRAAAGTSRQPTSPTCMPTITPICRRSSRSPPACICISERLSLTVNVRLRR